LFLAYYNYRLRFIKHIDNVNVKKGNKLFSNFELKKYKKTEGIEIGKWRKPLNSLKPHVQPHQSLGNTINRLHYPEYNIYLNYALKYKLKECIQLFGDFLSDFKTCRKIISVGSGNGYFEYLINKIFNINIICIDPTPNNFLSKNDGPFIQPNYETVDSLLLENNSKEDCLLILNWVTNDEDGNYDVEAIKKLNPIGIFIIYEQTGIAGSELFHQIRPLNKGNMLELPILNSNSNKLIYDFKRTEYFIHNFAFAIDSYRKIN